MPGLDSNAESAGIAERILVLRGQRVLLDADLANLYGITVRRLNEQVRRNRVRFPEDFAFYLNINEITILKSQTATSSWGVPRARNVSSALSIRRSGLPWRPADFWRFTAIFNSAVAAGRR